MAVIGLESTSYQVSEDVGVVEVCAVVNSPRIECHIEFLFEISISTSHNTSGMTVSVLSMKSCCHAVMLV